MIVQHPRVCAVFGELTWRESTWIRWTSLTRRTSPGSTRSSGRSTLI